MKTKRIFTVLLAILLVCCIAVPAAAGETFEDEYISLQIPDNYQEDISDMTGALTKGAYCEMNADGESTGDRFYFYILQNNYTRMSIEDMQKEEMRQELKSNILDTLKKEGESAGANYKLSNVQDDFKLATHFTYYNLSLNSAVTYLGTTTVVYQSMAIVPINDCTFYFIYTSLESREKAEQECAALLDNLQILIEPTDKDSWIVFGTIGGAVIGALIGLIVALNAKQKKKKAAQQAAYPYPVAPNGQYPANGQYPNVPPQYPPYTPNGYAPQNQPQNPQQYTPPTQMPTDSQNTQNF